MNLELLKKEIPYKWKVQTAKEWGCECVAYIDARDVMDILDEVVGPTNWQDSFREVGGKMYCTLSIKVDYDWISKEDVGTPSNMDADKGEASDAFKRAAVKWGIGRFLYDLGTERVKSIQVGQKYFPADEHGKRVYNLTEYIHNRKTGAPVKKTYTPKPAPASPTVAKNTTVEIQAEKPAADPAQRDEIRALSEKLGMDGTALQKKLKGLNLSWKTLSNEDAANVIVMLEAEVNAQKA